ncbi:hypothetical protein Dform_01745 [Dehalogenimonas formicexedens]|uniref:Transcriptional regulator n=1 Tax=Dehalogenimonas formicexedens TaxID=1839801 RepID=A0A1P8F9C0_9CHLR|nr:hypothetical protein [Dehalogenimonas formicexedens]APV45064.1 hypothetical protein Dform_01745 [Dehalogenimonas formicexedens]
MTENSQVEKHLQKLAALVNDPIHKRIIEAYKGNNPLESMEAELTKILDEVVTNED